MSETQKHYSDAELYALVNLSAAAYPGPWRRASDGIAGSRTEGDGGDVICAMPDEGDWSRAHWEANRAFIVAATNFVRTVIRREQEARQAALSSPAPTEEG